MKSHKVIALFALVLIPTVASAQIVIEGINSEDPSAPPPVEETTDGEGDEGTAGEEEAPAGMPQEDQDKIKAALLADLTSRHKKCLRGSRVRRPHKVGGQGSATYEINGSGTAKPKKSSSMGASAMFFKSEAAMKELGKKAREKTSDRGNKAFGECAKASKGVKVGVEGPATVELAFEINWDSDATLSVTSFTVEVPAKPKKKDAEAAPGE